VDSHFRILLYLDVAERTCYISINFYVDSIISCHPDRGKLALYFVCLPEINKIAVLLNNKVIITSVFFFMRRDKAVEDRMFLGIPNKFGPKIFAWGCGYIPSCYGTEKITYRKDL